MTILVTGDTGFIGGRMASFLKSRNVEFLGYSRSKGLDILNLNQLLDSAKRCDLIYHFAAWADPAGSVTNPLRTVDNIRGCLNALEAAKALRVPLIYPSTCEIYGDSEIPISEDHRMNPPNPYALSKLTCDLYCQLYHRLYEVDVKVARFFNPYGPGQPLKKVVSTFYLQAERGEPLTVYGDGSDTRDYTYIDDIIRGLWMMRKASPGSVVNLCTGVETSNRKLAELIRELSGSESEIVNVSYPNDFGGIHRQVGCPEVAWKLLGWRPKVDLKEGIKKTMRWLNEVHRS